MPISVGHCPILLRAAAVLVLCLAKGVAAAPVDLALVLAVDVSRSVDEEEYRIQKDGYADAFGSRAVIEAIESGPIGRIVVTYVEWSGTGRQRQLVPWTLVSDPASAFAFADAIRAAPRAYSDFTAVGAAIDFSVRLFDHLEHDPARRVIDVSGDGISNAGTPTQDARDRAVTAGITVNAVTILNEQWKLDQWYREHVIGGPGAFLTAANDFEDFRLAIVSKLVREIASLPAPSDLPATRFAAAPPP